MNLFFPSHDIALGNGVKHFNPPFAARRLEEDLCDLEKIWNRGRKDSEQSLLPWGWNYDTRALLNKEYGIKLKNLPTNEDLELLRKLSSRETTIKIIKYLKDKTNAFENISIPEYIDSEEKLLSFIENNQDFVLKTPWSSSGRGLSISKVCPKEVLAKHGAATIRKMGGIMGENWYNKVQDFAMLFYVGKDKVDFVGYSLFDNDESGTYRAGKLLSNDKIVEFLCSKQNLPQEILDRTKDNLLYVLNEMFTPFFGKDWEVGYIGIDMMIVKGNMGKGNSLHPCIEMNLRCTMGVVARLYFDQNCEENETGEFYITPALEHDILVQLDNDLHNIHSKKYHRLSNILPESMFMAYAIFN